MADNMAKNQDGDDLLGDLFDAAKSDPAAVPDPDFMTRVLSDAEALQPQIAQQVLPTRQTWLGNIRTLLTTLGGWQGAGGLVAATMASVWIGFSGPEAVTLDGLQSVFSEDTDFYLSDLGSDFSFDFGEG